MSEGSHEPKNRSQFRQKPKKARKQAKQQRIVITYLNSYLCITENNRTITSDQSELKQGNDDRKIEKNARNIERNKESLLIKKSWELSKCG